MRAELGACPERSIDASLGQAHCVQKRIVIRIFRRMSQYLLGFRKRAARRIEGDFGGRLRVLDEHTNVIVEHFEKTALNDKQVLFAFESVGENTRLEAA